MILLNQALCNRIVKGYFFGIQNKLSSSFGSDFQNIKVLKSHPTHTNF